MWCGDGMTTNSNLIPQERAGSRGNTNANPSGGNQFSSAVEIHKLT